MTEIIDGSVDRVDTHLFVPIPVSHLSDFEMLYVLLCGSLVEICRFVDNRDAWSQSIKNALVFVNSRTNVDELT